MISLSEATAWSTPYLDTKRQRAPDWDTETSIAYKQLPPDGDRIDNRHNERAPRRAPPEPIQRLEDVVPNHDEDLVADRELKRAHPQHASQPADNPYGTSLRRDREQLPEHTEMMWTPALEQASAIGGVEEMQDRYRKDVAAHSSYLSHERVERGGDNLSGLHIDPGQTEHFGYQSRELPLPLRQRTLAEPRMERQSASTNGDTLMQKPIGRTAPLARLRQPTTRVEYAPITTQDGVKLLRIGGNGARPGKPLRDADSTRDDLAGKLWSRRALEAEPANPPVSSVAVGMNAASERQYFETERTRETVQEHPGFSARTAEILADEVAIAPSRTSDARRSYGTQRREHNSDITAAPSHWTNGASPDNADVSRATRNAVYDTNYVQGPEHPHRFEQSSRPSAEETMSRFNKNEVFLSSSLAAPNMRGHASVPELVSYRRQSEGYLDSRTEHARFQPRVHKYLDPDEPDAESSEPVLAAPARSQADMVLASNAHPPAKVHGMREPADTREESSHSRAFVGVVPSNLTFSNLDHTGGLADQQNNAPGDQPGNWHNVRAPPTYVSLMAPMLTTLHEEARSEIVN